MLNLFRSALSGMLLLASGGGLAQAADTIQDSRPLEVRVLVIKYFPVKGDRIDRTATGDWGESLQETRKKTTTQTEQVAHALQEGSRYHGYKDKSAKPALIYKIVDVIEFLEPLPTVAKSGTGAPMTDYNRIMERVGIKSWVEEKGVKEVWLWGYHGGVLNLWESNMSGPFGDISNSNRDPKDLPVLGKTYTVYHYNYQRGASEAVEDHIHQIEAVLNFVDGRDRTPPEQWPSLLFWGKFVGSDRTHRIVHPGCGWAHYPPNAEQDYDWANKRYVETDIEDWKPDGTGKTQRMNCDRWGGDSLKWFVYWMQNIPGADNGLVYKGKPLNNWWMFIGDFDAAMQRKMTLVGDAAKADTGVKVYISTDMEGCSGVNCSEQVAAEEGKQLMAGDMNACIEGCFAAGATEVIVWDGHAGGRNVNPQSIDRRAKLIQGSTPRNRFKDIEGSVAMILLGYHAKALTPGGTLAHSYSSASIQGMWLNGREVGEIGVDAAIAAEHKVPVVMVSGDDKTCAEARSWIPGVMTCQTKKGTGPQSADLVPLEESRRLITQTAKEALAKRKEIQPIKIDHPATIRWDYLPKGSLRTHNPLFKPVDKPRRVEKTGDFVEALLLGK